MENRKNIEISRRSFLCGAAASGMVAFPAFVPSYLFGNDNRPSPSNRITMGFIGTGSHGTGHNLASFLRQEDAHVLAVCDVDSKHRQKACDMVNERYKNGDCRQYGDFREIIARKDIDGVMISTPDHWHVPMSLMALCSGKDVICEKPTLTIEEGRILSDTVRRLGAVFQTSTEDRSVPQYHRMAELVRNGRIGKLHTIRITLPNWSGASPEQQKTAPVPEGFDYEMWLGPAPYSPYAPGRCHWHFRWIRDYSAGMLADWGTHMVDTAQWANNTEFTGPLTIEGKAEFPTQGIYDAARNFHLEYTYANGVRLLIDSGGTGLRFEGSEGWVGNASWRAPVEASSKKILESVIRPEETHLYTCPGGEHRNFLDCVKSRRKPYFPAEIGHRLCSLLHAGNIAMLLGRRLEWNPEKEEFFNDATANRMRSRSMRAPWTL